jgi:hypothetical protein
MAIGIDAGGAVGGYETVMPAAGAQDVVIFRSGSVRPTRRAVLHVHAPGDAEVPAGLVSWYTERGFEFYLVQAHVPGARLTRRGTPAGRAAHLARPAASWPAASRRARWLGQVFAELDAATAHVRQADGMDHVFVTALGRSAVPVALWTDARQRPGGGQSGQSAGADALILYGPAFPARRGLCLHIGCPVLVLTACGEEAASARPRGSLRTVPALSLGAHVTWRQLPRGASGPMLTCGADLHEVCGELGRWLGAYMYGQTRDRLL